MWLCADLQEADAFSIIIGLVVACAENHHSVRNQQTHDCRFLNNFALVEVCLELIVKKLRGEHFKKMENVTWWCCLDQMLTTTKTQHVSFYTVSQMDTIRATAYWDKIRHTMSWLPKRTYASRRQVKGIHLNIFTNGWKRPQNEIIEWWQKNWKIVQDTTNHCFLMHGPSP